MPAERTAAMQGAYRPSFERFFDHSVPWVGCQYPTPALAQEAGMGTTEFADFLYGACLRDWDAERERMQRYADRFDAAEEVRIVGAETDVRLSVAGRAMEVDAGGANIPGGEFFCSPVEDSAEGTIAFTEFPAVYAGREINGIRLRFEGGRVVDASAETNEAYLVETLDSDEGARRLGELGIGCNPGITRYMKNTLFDEKIDGTVHLALGNGFPNLGGTNLSRVHWDIVKDLRMAETRIELDGEVVQRDGAWLI
jgi:aminopeptidase